MVVDLPNLRDAYRLASELRRVAGDFVVEMRVERAPQDSGRVLVPQRLAGTALVREIVHRYGGTIRR